MKFTERRQQIKSKTAGAAAGGGAGFITDRDENGNPKAPEKAEVPRLATDKKAAPAPKKDNVVQMPAPAAPAAPVTAPATAAPIPEGGTFDITTLSTEALAKAIKALTSISEFEEDKSAQALIEEMAATLKTRPIEQEEPKAAPAAAPMPMAAAEKTKKTDEVAVPLGGLTIAGVEDEEFMPEKTASWFVEDLEVTESGGRTPEIEEAHSKLDDNTGIPHPETTRVIKLKDQQTLKTASAAGDWVKPEFVAQVEAAVEDAQLAFWEEIGKKFPTAESGDFPFDADHHFEVACQDAVAIWVHYNVPGAMDDTDGTDGTDAHMGSKSAAADLSTNAAAKKSEKLGEDLKRTYLEAKSLTGVNDTRAVREAVEAIFRAANLFDDCTKVLNKQRMQEEAEANAAKIKDQNKGKKSSFDPMASLNLAAGE